MNFICLHKDDARLSSPITARTADHETANDVVNDVSGNARASYFNYM